MKRKLGQFEKAEALSDEYSCFNVVGILFLESGPSVETLRKALKSLQRRHPLLRVKILKQGKKLFFDTSSIPEIPLDIIERSQKGQWEQVVESALNTRLDSKSGPLVHAAYLFKTPPYSESELILTCHHSIVDASSMVTLYKELLSLCSKIEERDSLDVFSELPLLPPEEDFFPPAYKGISRKWHTTVYLLRQIGDEITYRRATKGKPHPKISSSGKCRILPVSYPSSLTEKIVRASRSRKISLNSLLSASMLLAAAKKIYKRQDLPLRYFIFADLRPYLSPPVSEEHLGTYHSMMRLTTHVKKNQDIWDLAESIQRQTYKNFKRGDKFVSPLLSPPMMRMIIRLKSMRMGTTALSYQGSIKFPSVYGKIRVRSTRGYISNFPLGPEYTAAARIYNKELLWDILYLDSDMDLSFARSVAQEIQDILESACR